MRLPRFSKRLLSLGLLSGFLAGAGGCSSEYGLFDIHVFFANGLDANDRQDVEFCKLTVTDPSGKALLKNYIIEAIVTVDGTVTSGCAGGRTPQVVGDVSYSTSRTSGTLSFTVNAVNAGDTTLYSGSASKAIKVFNGPSDEQKVDVQLAKP
jgi:hypothetical protein